MLQQLSVRNFAIIDHTDIQFQPGFNIITGETGAGKSILLGALGLILGQRAELQSLLNPNQKAIIEATFHLKKENNYDFFIQHDLDFDTQTIIRREILPSGKSRAFINDTPVRLDVLRQLSAKMVDLHQQHESLSLTSKEFQRNVLDTFAGLQPTVQTYQALYFTFKEKQKQLDKLQSERAKQLQEKDYIEFQFNELDEANLSADELVHIEQELSKAEHFEELRDELQSLQNLFNGEEASLHQLAEAEQILRKLARLNADYEQIHERFKSAILEIEDIANDINHESLDEMDEFQREELSNRNDIYNRLLTKHHLQSADELIALRDRLSNQLESFSFTDQEIQSLQLETEQLHKELTTQAIEIRQQRIAILNPLKKAAEELLEQVGMTNATIEVRQTDLDELTASGKDEIELLFSANKGMRAKPLKQIASGGELSRLMLVIKTLIAEKAVLPTLIFDEIDTGISGETAMKVGAVLRQLSQHHQIISITHLPQIAAKGNHHLKVTKRDVDGEMRSTVITLTKDERILEIAEMLSGANPSATNLQAAKELMA